jgi:regulator of sigma D
MEKEYVAALFGFIGVIVGGIITSFSKYIELRQQAKQEKRNLALSKIEELHEKLSLFTQEIAKYQANILQMKIHRTTDTSIYLNSIDQFYFRFSVLNTSLKLYCPELVNQWKAISNSLNNYVNACSNFLTSDSRNLEISSKYGAELLKDCSLLLDNIENKHFSIFNNTKQKTELLNSQIQTKTKT